MDQEFGVGRYKLLHTEWMEKEVLVYSTGNYIQRHGINHNGKEYRKSVHVCRTALLILRYTAEINVTM